MEGFHTRTLRCDERDLLLDHLATVFGAKGTPRELFEDHLHNDPYLDMDGIFIAIAPDGKIASSVRVYRRSLKLRQGEIIPVGAIGDVATHHSHTGKGLASLLMAKAENYMRSKDISVAMLHTRSAARLYAKLGYMTRSMKMLSIPVDLSRDDTGLIESWSAMEIDFSQKLHLDAIRSLHEGLAPLGSFARSEEYWTKWVAPAPRDPKYHVVRMMGRGRIEGEPFTAYLFVDVAPLDKMGAEMPPHSSRLAVWEFFAGFDAQKTPVPNSATLDVLRLLVRQTVSLSVTNPALTDVEVQLPRALLRQDLSSNNPTPDDDGWMFKALLTTADLSPVLQQLELDSQFGFLKSDAF